MKGVLLKDARRSNRPDRNFREAKREAVEADRDTRVKGINKRVNTLKLASDTTKDASGDSEFGPMCPSDEQLAEINKFTRSPKTADEVVCFPTLSCNDIVDRDFDQFTTKTVKEFAALEQPFSSVGKSYMVGHDYSKLPVGRIFDVETAKADSALHLKNWVYIPNTDANKSFIENLDYGINWAVSVGVTLGKSGCSVCDSPVSSFFGFCYENGHFKGAYYDPNSDAVDDWGYALEADPDDPGAVLCFNKLEEPRDFYELSQVYLGAQYFAALDEKSALGAVVKAASASEVPIIGLSKSEADQLPFPHEPLKVTAARERYEIKTAEDGSMEWVDEQGLLWTFDPEEDEEVTCLGKYQKTNEEVDDATTDEERQSGEPSEASVGGSDEPVDGAGGSDGAESVDVDGTEDGKSSSSDGERVEDAESSSAAPPVTNNNEEENSGGEGKMSKQAILTAARKAKLPEDLIEAAEKAGGDLLVDLLSGVNKETEKLREKAALGDNYLKTLRADAIHWYVRAHQDGDRQKPVKTETFERILNACGDDPDLIKSLIEEKKELAQARFPEAVRRSSFPEDVNKSSTPGALPDEETWGENDEKVSRLHG